LIGNAAFGKLDFELNHAERLTVRFNASRFFGDNNVFFDPASPLTVNALSANGEEEVATESLSANLLSTWSPRLIGNLRVQASHDRQQSFENNDGVRVKITEPAQGYDVPFYFGRSSILPRKTNEWRLHAAETISYEAGRHGLKVGGDANLVWITNFFPAL